MTLSIVEPIAAVAEPGVSLTLMQAVLKGAAMDDVVRDATMMGAARIRPVLTEHVRCQAVGRHARRERRPLEAGRDRVGQAVRGARQSRRSRRRSPFDAAMSRDDPGLRLMFVEPSAGAKPARCGRYWVSRLRRM